MDWSIVSKASDILGIIGFAVSIFSLGFIRKIISKITRQKETYNKERENLLTYLSALRENIWHDGIISPRLQDQLQELMFSFQIKYLSISSPRCIFHTFRCVRLLRRGITDKNSSKLHEDINYLLAQLSKQEDTSWTQTPS